MPEHRRPAARQAEPEHHDHAPLITARYACRKTSSSPEGRLRASAPANTNLTAHHLQIAPLTATTRQRVRHRRGSRARRHSHCRPSAASVRPKRIKHKRQIPIGRNRALHPAGSFLGGFRTPASAPGSTWMAGIRNPSPERTFERPPSDGDKLCGSSASCRVRRLCYRNTVRITPIATMLTKR
jgi:hypothetical protein